jgi:hypothetical protein
VIHTSNVFALIGLVFLACAIAGTVGLVTSMLYSGTAAALGTACAAGLLALLWFAGPLAYRASQAGGPPDEWGRTGHTGA